ncbi:MAG: hypothetical protein RLZZ210_1677 [Pseudomonadota bacterium]
MSFFDSIMNTVIGEVKENFLGNDSASNNLLMGVLSMLSNKNSESGLVNDLLSKFGVNDGILGGISNIFGGSQNSEHNSEESNSLGGLDGLKNLLEQNGLAEQVQSWIGTGENLPVSAEQIQQALDSNGTLSELASKANVTKETASELLSNIIPNVIDKITPNGSLPEGGLDFAALVKQFIKI